MIPMLLVKTYPEYLRSAPSASDAKSRRFRASVVEDVLLGNDAEDSITTAATDDCERRQV